MPSGRSPSLLALHFMPNLALVAFFIGQGLESATALKLQVSVEAAWPAAPLAAEILEGFVQVGRGSEYLKALTAEAGNFSGDVSAWRHAAARVAEAQLCCGGKNSLFANFLSFRVRHFAASAQVEAARGLERTDRTNLLKRGITCEAGTPWVAYAVTGVLARMACGAEALAVLADFLEEEHGTAEAKQKTGLFRTHLDHVMYYKKHTKGGLLFQAIGYGDLADPSATAMLFQALEDFSEALKSSGRAGYVAFRHGAAGPSTTSHGKTALAGYGVALLKRSADEVTKSIDAEASNSSTAQGLVPDDGQCTWAAAQGTSSKSASAGDPAEFFHGLDLSVVAQRHPVVAPALCSLREELRAAVEDPIPPWQLKYLGVYAALRAAEVSKGPGGPLAGLAALEEMAQDFPSGWAHALSATAGGSEATVQDLMQVAERDLPGAGQVEVNGRKVQGSKFGTLQLLQTHAPLFNAVEQLGHAGFEQRRVAECLRDSRPAPPLPERFDAGDPRLEPRSSSLEVAPVILYDVRTDPAAEYVRRSAKSEDSRMHPQMTMGPGTGSLVRFVTGIQRRGDEYPMQLPRAVLGVSLTLDICEKEEVELIDRILQPTPPLILWVYLATASADGKKVVDLMRGALEMLAGEGDDGRQKARKLLNSWYQDAEGSFLCNADSAEKRLRKLWEKFARPAEKLKPVQDKAALAKSASAQDLENRESQLNFAFNTDRPAQFPTPSVTVNGHPLIGHDAIEGFDKVANQEMQRFARALMMHNINWRSSDEEFARWQYKYDSGHVMVPPLLHLYHPALSPGDSKTAAQYVPVSPDKLWGLPGGFVARQKKVPPNAPLIAHTLVLADPAMVDEDAESSKGTSGGHIMPAMQLVGAYAERLAAIPVWRRWWLGIAVAGGCAASPQAGCTEGSPLGLAGALRRCLMAAAPGRVSAEELKKNSVSGGSSGKAEELEAALKSLTAEVRKSAGQVTAAMAEGEEQAAKALLKACDAAARSSGVWSGRKYLRPEELQTTEADVEMWARHQEVERLLGPVNAEGAVISVNGRKYGPVYPTQSGISFHAGHLAFAEEVDLMYLPPLGGPLGKQVDWRGQQGETWPGAGVNRVLRQAGAQEDPLLMAYALAHRSKVVADMASMSRDGKDGRDGDQGDDESPDGDDAGDSELEKAFNKAPSDLLLKLPCPEDAPCPFRIFAVIDPLGEGAQRLPPVFRALREELGAELNLALRPRPLVESPLDTYYRAAMAAPAPAGGLGTLGEWDGLAPGTEFALPARRSLMLSVRLHTPESWLCSAVDSEGADLDALKAVEDRVVHARYNVEALFVEGWATLSKGIPGGYEPAAPGRHLALTPLGGEWPEGADFAGSDSVVVKSGYFQLRAPPGMYTLSSDVSNDEDGIMFDSLLQPEGPVELVELTSGGAPMQVKVDMTGGHVHTPGSKAAAAASFEGAGGDPRACKQTIHIFSVASGHRYERLLRIMMLSVREHTKCPLRLWLVDNFLSPNFRRLLPSLARRVGFEVSRVTYKWPAWLREQTQKQRIIWAYKILFLDVFFPIQVRRVLFIDADQIVRADVQELWKMNLNHHVYGFVPFCGSGPKTSSWFSSSDRDDLKNQETVGFRFWEQGFWQNHLGHNTHYHISALFVVDLVAFRAAGAGDILRDVYQSLTADPGSLANLDQDLPNYVQRMLPIFSLPQDWLWCESWCSEASKKQAKTIDMCQHPVNKEGKLQQARRIAPEWVDYDARLDAWIREANMTA